MQRLELREERTTHSFTYLGVTHAAFIVCAALVAIIWRAPTVLVLAAPSLVVLASAATAPRVSRPSVGALIDRPRALEGDTITVTVGARARGHVPLIEIEMVPNKELDHEGPLRTMTSLEAGSEFQADFRLLVEQWGVVELGQIKIRVRDRFGLSAINTTYLITSKVRIHIHEEPARRLTEPNRFRRLVGSHLSEERGEGLEIADIRPYQPGDRLQSLNWRISARNDEPWITLRHPDRSTTFVLLLDAYQTFGQQHSDGLRRSVRATLGLARLHLGAQDPVGMMILGTGVRWLPPELGKLHLHKMTDALLDLSTRSWSDKRQNRGLVERLIPKDAVVLAISPLTDQRFVNVLTSLRARGQSVQVIEPITHWPQFAVNAQMKAGFTPVQSWRIYSLHRQAYRSWLSAKGVPIVPWDEEQPIEAVLLGLRLSQRARQSGAAR